MDSAVTGQLQNVVSDLTNSFKNLANQIQQLSTSLQRLATAGLQATAEGNRLSFVWLMFTRQIAGIVLPVVNFLIDKITMLTQWFKGLSGDAQFLLLKVSLVAASFTMLLPILSMITTILNPMSIMMGLVANALIFFFTETQTGKELLDLLSAALQWVSDNLIMVKNAFEIVVGFLTKGFQIIVAGFTWLGIKLMEILEEILDWVPGMGDAVASIRKFRQETQAGLDVLNADIASPIKLSSKLTAEKGAGRPRQDVNPSGFGFESLSASFERITSAANKTDLQREMAETQKKQLEQQKLIAAGIGVMASGAAGATVKKGDV